MALGFEFVVFTIAVALLFDFFNGVNDAANSIATIVGTKVLRPWQAVGLAAIFNFIGPFWLGTEVASTVGKGIVDPDVITTELILGALVGGIAWTWFCTHFGLPISVSHSLIGGLVGAGLAAVGVGALELPTMTTMRPAFELMEAGAIGGAIVGVVLSLLTRGKNFAGWTLGGAFLGSGAWLAANIFAGAVQVKGLFATILFIFYSPMLGFLGGFLLNVLLLWLFQRASPYHMQKTFGYLQIVSASFYSLGHGTNDAQKTMGVIAVLLLANGYIDTFYVPTWVILSAASAIALGTLIGGYKVVRTMGMRLTHLEPYQGFSAETSSALGLYFLAEHGVPVSTTHSITGSILGVGAVKGQHAVRWEVARSIVGAWIFTIPASAAVAAVVYYVVRFVIGVL